MPHPVLGAGRAAWLLTLPRESRFPSQDGAGTYKCLPAAAAVGLLHGWVEGGVGQRKGLGKGLHPSTMWLKVKLGPRLM